MVNVLRTRNAEFETGSFPPWVATGDVIVTDDVACSGFHSALFEGDGTGAIEQTNTAYPGRMYELRFRAGATGGTEHAPLQVTVDFLSSSNQLLRRFRFTIPADSLPDVTGATPEACDQFVLDAGISPPGTARVRVRFAKTQPGGADILVDAIFLIERTV